MGFLDKIKMHGNVKKIMSQVMRSSSEQGIFDINLKFVSAAIYALKNDLNFVAYMDPVSAACYCVESYEEGKPFYALIYVNSDTGEICRQSKEITQFVASSLNAYKSENYEYNNNNAFYNTAAEVLDEINKAIKGCTLVGFINDKSMADIFETFEYTENTSVDDLYAAWQSIDTFERLRLSVFTTPPPYESDVIKMNILKRVLGAKIRSLPNKVRGSIIGSNRFKTISWQIIMHQLQCDEPIDENAYMAVVQYSDLSSALIRINDLRGLNFGKKIQVDAIKLAAYLGDEYVDELYTQDGWLNEAEMENKYKEFKEIAEKRRKEYAASPEGQRERQRYMEWLEESEVRMQQENLQRQQAKVQKNLPLQVELGQVKAEIDLLKAEKSNTYDIAAQIRLARQIEALEEQCKEIERKMR